MTKPDSATVCSRGSLTTLTLVEQLYLVVYKRAFPLWKVKQELEKDSHNIPQVLGLTLRINHIDERSTVSQYKYYFC